MPEYDSMGNEVNVYIDGVLVGTSQIDEGSVQFTIPEEFTSKEGFHIISVDPIPIQDPANCEIEGAFKSSRKYTDAFMRAVNKEGRKKKDNKKAKIPKRLRNGWKQ